MNKTKMIKCLTCEKEFNYYSSEYRPFCCEKCKMVDLGHWFKETYKVPEKELDHNKENAEIQKTKNHPNDGEDAIDEDSEYL